MTDFHSDEDWKVPKPAKYINASFTVLIAESILEPLTLKLEPLESWKKLVVSATGLNIRAY